MVRVAYIKESKFILRRRREDRTSFPVGPA
jgi:hypothetical protein